MNLKEYYNSACKECFSLKLLYIVSEPMAAVFIKLKTSAFTITTLSFITSILSCYFLYEKNFLLFSFLVFISLIFDICDGIVARATKTSSELGAFYDHFSDKIKIGLLYLTVGLSYNDISIWVLSFLNLQFFLFMSVLNEECTSRKKASFTNTSSSILQATVVKKSSFRIFLRTCYNSVFLIYGNFMLYFIGLGYNKDVAIVTLIFMLIVILKSFKEIFVVRLRFALKG